METARSIQGISSFKKSIGQKNKSVGGSSNLVESSQPFYGALRKQLTTCLRMQGLIDFQIAYLLKEQESIGSSADLTNEISENVLPKESKPV